MKIAVRNGKDGEWKRIPDTGQQVDGSLKKLIHDVPELISVEELEPGNPSMKVCISDTSVTGSDEDSGLIGIDDNGQITIVECKVASDPANRRKIVGQALEYAAILWEMSYDDFDAMVLASEGKPLTEIMGERVPASEWAEDTFRSAVTSSLRQGKFRLIMVIQGLTNELRRTIKFLSARGPFSFETYVVEMQHFSDGNTEIVIPRITSFADVEKRDISAKPDVSSVSTSESMDVQLYAKQEPNFGKAEETKQQDAPEPALTRESAVEPSGRKDKRKEALFFAKCQDTVKPKSVEIIRKLYVFSMEIADNIMWWGSGGAGAFNFVLTEDQLTVFIVDANGRIMFNFSEWQREPTYKSLLPQFIEKLKDTPILRQQKDDYTKWPDFGVEEFFGNQNDVARFEMAVKFLKEELSKLVPV